MKVLFVREGNACNSSDDHNIVLTHGKEYPDREYEDYCYERERFLLGSKQAKAKYCMAILGLAYDDVNYDSWKSDTVQKSELKNFYNRCFKDILGPMPKSSAVDCRSCDADAGRKCLGYYGHQSILATVYNQGSWDLCVEFYQEFFKEILSEKYAIIGGSDECENEADGKDLYYLHKFLKDFEWCKIHCRYDESGCYVLHAVPKEDYKSFGEGGILLVTFGDKPVPKLKTPYLIDLGISDWCAHGCSFCYRNCTLAGKEVDYEKVNSFVWKLFAEHGVAEIVLGGGNLYEQFNEIAFSKGNGVLSSTIHFKDFLKAMRNGDFMLWTSLSTLAVSVTDCTENEMKEVYKYAERWNKLRIHPTVRVQHIAEMLTTARHQFLRDNCYNVAYTLLGYKNFGRGSTEDEPKLYDGFWKAFKESKGYDSVPVDATFAEKYKKELVLINDENNLRTAAQEGVGSCFIDLVNMKMYKNSHSTEGVPIDPTKEGWLEEAFAKL